MNIKEQTTEFLKAFAFDQIVLIEKCQNNLKFINTELESRENKTPLTQTKDDKKK
jgi:hypothetical protein